MKNEDTGQGLIDIVFIGMYLLIGGIWFSFYRYQGQDVWFNSSYDYLTLILFQIVSGVLIIGYVRFTGSVLIMGFLSLCGILALPVLIQGYRGAIYMLMLVESFTQTRVIVLLIHITIYIIIGLEFFYAHKNKKKCEIK